MNATTYALVMLDPSGDVFAVRVRDDVVTGVCGPLHYTEQDAPGADYEYDTDPDVLAQWNGNDETRSPAYRYLRHLD